MRTFTCGICGNTYGSETTEEEMLKEFTERFPESSPSDIVHVCEGCDIELMEWYNSLPEEEKQRMIEEEKQKKARSLN